MKVIDRTVSIDGVPKCYTANVDCHIKLVSDVDECQIYTIKINTDEAIKGGVEIKWKIPCLRVKGVWSTNSLHEKRLLADWELPKVSARVSVDAPVLTVYDHSDYNVIAFAISDVINSSELEASIQEEDGCIYCIVRLMVEASDHIPSYSCELRVSTDRINFGDAISEISTWWAANLSIANVPEATTYPVYSTWYSYHQNFEPQMLLDECKAAKKLGYKGIIVDDGWQTKDGNRGYNFTGDWEVERIDDVHGFVKQIHNMDMYCLFWFSVPFCGIESKAYQAFKGKFLTENHPWAPVFDPRYPEVRAHLVSRYAEAVRDWKLDGLKLDFIDDFKVYEDTDLREGGGKDCLSVNEGVKKLIDLIKQELYAINPDVLIEFRQKYTGPYLQTLGNMFRAFDAPYDSLTNRIRTTDVKLLSGETIVHSDMFAWHPHEEVEVAALQLTNILFSVPQLSVRLKEVSQDHKNMIAFLTHYWNENKQILLFGDFKAYRPSSNYPMLSSSYEDKIIYGVYEDMIVSIQSGFRHIDLINGKLSDQVVFELTEDLGKVEVVIVDCSGQEDWKDVVDFEEGVHTLEVPANGIIQLKVISS